MEKFKSLFCRQEGQALLIVVLIMVVTLTSALSIASRTITNVKTSAEEERSQRAFAAAEAGIEKSLKLGGPQNGNFQSSSFTADSSPMAGGSEFLVNDGLPVEANEGVDIHLGNNPPSYTTGNTFTNFNVYWGEGESCPNIAAIEVVVVYAPKDNPTTKRFVYDPCSRGNNFTSAIAVGAAYKPFNKSYPYRTPSNGSEVSFIDLNSAALLARIVPLYKTTKMAVTVKNAAGVGSETLPSQGDLITSVGTSSETTRKIEVLQPYPKLPSEFFYVLFKAKQ